MQENKNSIRRRILISAILCGALSAIAVATPAVKKWLFTDKNEMEQIVRQYASNPRATYHIINRAHKRNLGAQAVAMYHDLLQKKPNDPYLQSAFAYSHFLAAGIFSRELTSQGSSQTVRQLQRQLTEASFYRDEAVASKPNSPVILVEVALFWAADGQNREKAIDLLRRAVKQDPKWADAQYHLGSRLSTWWKTDQAHRVKAGKEALPHLSEAERLQPELRPECLISRAYAYQMLDDQAKQLQCIEAYLKVRPEAAKEKWLVKWRKSAQDDLAKEKKPGA